ncbi:MAG: radical SAM protein [Kofleriaceae bacterium]|jgi:radical SAM protein with 4Fe4S-binding SPASM domain|nr:radical SAM protein [Kofleriaceae bacterium]MBP6840181.1 radical SAM protein [Kofleriaceae bacterium]MBP9204884.1 radical SAM protein [Kofleriaceae bacterium]
MIGAVRRWLDRARPRQARLEGFGAIVQLTTPRALVFVDREYARGLLGVDDETRWSGPEPALGQQVLTAPLEAHLQLTNKCGAGCAGCYTGASPAGAPREWGLREWMAAIDDLADAGVFHVALGGGESATLPWLGDLARHARVRGLVPNLTTSGLDGLDRLLPIAELFGQINVSIDGLGATYAAVRGFDGFARADHAVRALRAVKREVGINVVVTRHNVDQLDDLFAYARRRRLVEVELLRFKPAGRGAGAYAGQRCTDAQHRAFLPAVLAAARRHRVRVKVDCSYTPMLAHHGVDRALLASLAVYGCTGGDFLVGAKAGGQLTACSFAAPPPAGADGARPRADALTTYWREPGAFGAFRTWRDAAEPCRSCAYLTLCRGGCRVVSAHVAGDDRAPDPECPRVVDHQRSSVTSQAGTGASPRRHHLPVV